MRNKWFDTGPLARHRYECAVIATGKEPLAIAAMLAVLFGEFGVRWLLGQDLDAVWMAPCGHALLTYWGVTFICRHILRLHDGIAPSASRGEDRKRPASPSHGPRPPTGPRRKRRGVSTRTP